MTEQPIGSENNLEEVREDYVATWIKSFSETGVVGEMDASVMRSALEKYGANFEPIEGNEALKVSLGKYSNKGKHEGMKAVWGDKRKRFRDWTEKWADEYEERTGDKLPRIVFEDEETGEQRPSRTEGMRQFLGELTSYAVGILDADSFKERLEARHFNFHKRKEERRRIVVADHNNDKPFAPASVPPEFPNAALNEIQSWREENTSPLPGHDY